LLLYLLLQEEDISVVAQLLDQNLTIGNSEVHTNIFTGYFENGEEEQLYSQLNTNNIHIGRLLSKITSIFHGGLQGRLMPEVFNVFDMVGAFNDVTNMAENKSLQIQSQISGLYNCPLGVRVGHNYVNITIKVPIVDKKQIMQIYDFKNHPLPIRNGELFLKIKEPTPLLALFTLIKRFSQSFDVFEKCSHYN
jgi:hypothetical protein